MKVTFLKALRPFFPQTRQNWCSLANRGPPADDEIASPNSKEERRGGRAGSKRSKGGSGPGREEAATLTCRGLNEEGAEKGNDDDDLYTPGSDGANGQEEAYFSTTTGKRRQANQPPVDGSLKSSEDHFLGVGS